MAGRLYLLEGHWSAVYDVTSSPSRWVETRAIYSGKRSKKEPKKEEIKKLKLKDIVLGHFFSVGSYIDSLYPHPTANDNRSRRTVRRIFSSSRPIHANDDPPSWARAYHPMRMAPTTRTESRIPAESPPLSLVTRTTAVGFLAYPPILTAIPANRRVLFILPNALETRLTTDRTHHDTCDAFAITRIVEVIYEAPETTTKTVPKVINKTAPKLISKVSRKSMSRCRTRCYLDIAIDGEAVGRIVIELRTDVNPRTCENFRALCTAKYGYSYKECKFHRIIPNFVLQTGDVELKTEKREGNGGVSIYGRSFADEDLKTLRHHQYGIVSMANCGPHTNNSQFMIVMDPDGTEWRTSPSLTPFPLHLCFICCDHNRLTD